MLKGMQMRNAMSPHVSVKTPMSGESRTKQSFREETDINTIMSKYQRTGLISAVNQHAPQYGDVTGLDFQTAMETVTRAQQMFEAMPSSIRKRFANDPAQFLDFVQNDDNVEEARKLGLLPHPEALPPEKESADPQGPQQAPSGAPEPAPEGQASSAAG
jgi:phage internal scaffolding protein